MNSESRAISKEACLVNTSLVVVNLSIDRDCRAIMIATIEEKLPSLRHSWEMINE